MLDVRRASSLAIEEYALTHPTFATRASVWAGMFMISAFAGWAAVTELDVRAKGEGQVVTASQTQVIQNLEGGIVTALKVKNGDKVKAGQVLVQLSPVAAGAELEEQEANANGLRAAIARLSAESRMQEPSYPQAVIAKAPEIVAGERALHRERLANLDSQIDILESALNQKRAELNELEARVPRIRETLDIIEMQRKDMQVLVDARSAAPAELLALQKEAATHKIQLSVAVQSIPGARAGVRGAMRRIAEKREAFRAEALESLAERQVKLAALTSNITARKDRVSRTSVIAPVAGTVKTLHVTTPGEVVSPGHTIAEIVPTGDNLLVEARISPSDIGFVLPGQPCSVRLTAFDFAIYGSLEGIVDRISPDTVKDESDPRVIFYRVMVRTKKAALEGPNGKLKVMPGMVAEVDILTGRRTVLDYLFKPLTRARMGALTER